MSSRPPDAEVLRFEDLGIIEVETSGSIVKRTFVDFEDCWLFMVLSAPSGIADTLSQAESAELKRRLQA